MLNLSHLLAGRGLGVMRSPYLDLPRFHAYNGHNFLLNRMQGSYDLYAFGMHFWLVW